MELEGIKTIFKPHEEKRIYIYPCGAKIELYDVCELVVRPSGTHRLKTGDNHGHIIAPGWIHIELIIEDWTV